MSYLSRFPRLHRMRPDHLLLTITVGFLLTNTVALVLLSPENWAIYLGSYVMWLLLAVAGSYLLDRFLLERDRLLFPVVMLLSGWGLLVIARLLPTFALRQTVWLAIAVVVMMATALLPQMLRWLRAYRYVWLVSGLLLLLGTILFGRNPSGVESAPQLWLGVGNINFQPSELLKVILVVFLASYLAEAYPSLKVAGAISRNTAYLVSPRVSGPVLLMWGLSVVILVWQRDLGAAALFFIVFLTLMAIASGNWRVLAGGLLLLLLAGALAYLLFDVVRVRITIWLNPWPYADNDAFQIVQSLQAIAAGGVFGQGVGQGAPYSVPVAHSDFVLAALAEEWGLLGVVVVILMLALLVMRGLLIAARFERQLFTVLLATGLTTMLAAQSALIMGGVMGLVPLTGVTLPFLSYGGSSLLVSFLMIGILLRLSAAASPHGEHHRQVQ